MIRYVALFGLMFAALPAQAGTFTPPESCTVWMTVQAKACRVSNYFKCTKDPVGDQWRADFDQEGLFFQSRIDSEAQWVESFSMPGAKRQSLDAGAEDPASFSGLLATGLDTFRFGLTEDGVQTKVWGQDKLTGQTVTIDGITLKQTEFNFTETDLAGNILRQSHGNEYISPEWRTFFAGPGQTDLGDGLWRPIDGSPIEFIFPGEPGFAATQPLFDCDDLMSDAGQEGLYHVRD